MFFLVEGNLEHLRPILRKFGCSAFLPYEYEIGLDPHSKDEIIIAKIAEQKENLGIDRIIITRDKRFVNLIGPAQIKLIVLVDKAGDLPLSEMKKEQLCETIISMASDMIKVEGVAVKFIECSKFYK